MKMTSCEIQIGNPSVLSKIESFLNDSSYREAIENSATYNTRLCIERRLRMPFLDSQTGVAQNHSNLFMSPRQRIPGLIDGQIYTYPSKRWRKKRRQYLMNFMQPRRKEIDPEADLHTISTVENPAAVCNEDSKDSIGLKEEVPKEAWYYDEIDMQEMEGFDDPDPDSDFDYEESYTKRKKKPKKVTRNTESPAVKKPKGPGRGRKKTNFDSVADAEKPFACELCGARYKTRPGLTYHYTHSHKDRDEEDPCIDGTVDSKQSTMTTPGPPAVSIPQQQQQQPQPTPQPPPAQQQQPQQQQAQVVSSSDCGGAGAGSSTRRGRQSSTSATTQLTPVAPVVAPPAVPLTSEDTAVPLPVGPVDKKPVSETMTLMPEDKERAVPSPYCDFCLGDAQENKKTCLPEELVSCSDCGRSGHPTCLQFTPNMIISVRKYRWQCIECKCCSICGTSDNDDQLLFCDDCDRGYHMYCLAPPLTSPPEGSWSCHLCIAEFHNK
ncbi:zinc finger protein ubi-d4 isoform X2 [Anabrus simplex]|uniref:zinc finger protein ubi-d4 isoform X2 n=1 Tax=Anabrus simplex TaxID=316456 RepID=UPI0035A34325